MRLHRDWLQILKGAWSIRFIVLAFVFSAAEVALSFVSLPIAPGVAGAVSGLCAGAAFVSRIVAQKKLLGKLAE